jgi:hypothetical protein
MPYLRRFIFQLTHSFFLVMLLYIGGELTILGMAGKDCTDSWNGNNFFAIWLHWLISAQTLCCSTNTCAVTCMLLLIYHCVL